MKARRRARIRPLLTRPAVEGWLIALALAVGAHLLVQTGATARFDAAAYDALLRTVRIDAGAAPVIVAIDERSIDAIGRWPWPRATYAGVLDELHRLGARRVALDVLFADPDPDRPDSDAALAAALARDAPVVLPMVIDARRAGGQLLEILPAPVFLAASALVGHVHHNPDDDGVTRGFFLWQGIDGPHWPHLALALSGVTTAPGPPGPSSLQNLRAQYRLLPFVGPAGAMPSVSFLDVLHKRVPAASIRGKAVLIGMTAAAGADAVATPMTDMGRPMSGVEFNANAYLAIVNHALLQPLAPSRTALISALLAVLPMLLLPRLAPRQSLLVTFGIACLPTGVSLLLLHQAQLWFAPVSATTAMLVSYPLWTWRRLEQTLRTLRSEIGRLRRDVERTPLRGDDPNPEADVRFLEAILPVRRAPSVAGTQMPESGSTQIDGAGWSLHGARAVFQPSAGAAGAPVALDVDRPLSAQERALLTTFAARLKTPAPNDPTHEVLTMSLNRLHAAIAAQRSLLDVTCFGLMGMRDGVLLLGALGRPLFANDAARAMLGIDIAPGHHAGDLLDALRGTQADVCRSHLRDLFTLGTESMFEARAADGRELLVHLSPSAPSNQPDRIDQAIVPGAAAITLVDISAIRRAERTHRETLGFLSHDLRSPIVSLLALIRGASEGKGTEQTDGAAAGALYARMERYASRSLQNAEQFLQLTRIEHEPDMDVYELELGAVAENAIAQVIDQARASQMRIEFSCAIEDGVWVQGNGQYLERAIVNLLSNAIKYAPPATPIELSIEAHAGEALCTVRDHGAGIAAADLPNLFRAYFQATAQRGRGDGIGLGLRFVALVAERHAGSISAAAAPGGGARFTLRRPLHEG